MNGPDKHKEQTGQTPRASLSLEQPVLTQPASDWKAQPSLTSPCLAPACSSPHHGMSVHVGSAKGKQELRGLQDEQSCLRPSAAVSTGWKQLARCAHDKVWNQFLSRWIDRLHLTLAPMRLQSIRLHFEDKEESTLELHLTSKTRRQDAHFKVSAQQHGTWGVHQGTESPRPDGMFMSCHRNPLPCNALQVQVVLGEEFRQHPAKDLADWASCLRGA